VFEGVHVDPVVQQAGHGRHQPRSQFQIVLPTRQQGGVRHPHHSGVEGVGHRRQPVRVNQQIPAADIDFIL